MSGTPAPVAPPPEPAPAVDQLPENPPWHSPSAPARRFGPLAVLIAGLLLTPSVLDGYHTSLVSRALALGVMAVSVSILTGFAGLPSLGQAAPFVVGSYAAALLGRAGMTVGVVQVCAAAGAAAVFSAVTGLVVIRTRGVAFLMTTLAVAELTVTAAGRWKSVTGGTDGLYGIPDARPVWGARLMDSDKPVYWYVLACTAVAVAAAWSLLRSPAGRLLTASRDNETRMRSAGHPVTRYFFVAYVGAGALAGIGGALLVSVDQYVSPADAGFENSALVLLAVVIGGATSFLGALAGAGLIVATQDWLSGPFPDHGPLVLGLMFIAAVYLLPRGVAGVRLPARRRSGR